MEYKDEIVIPHVWHHYTPNNLSCSDIALFSKVVSKSNTNDKYTAIICGGLNATGTAVICNTIYDKWDSEFCSIIVRDNLDNNKNILDCEYFTIFYKVNGQSNVRYDPNTSISLEPILKLGK